MKNKNEFIKHFESAAADNGVKYVYVCNVCMGNRNSPWKAIHNERLIKIPKIIGEKEYSVAMHELGHIITHTNKMKTIDSECMAWKWAINNSIEWTNDMNRLMISALKSHIKSSINSTGNYSLVPKSHCVWKMSQVQPCDIYSLYKGCRKETLLEAVERMKK